MRPRSLLLLFSVFLLVSISGCGPSVRHRVSKTAPIVVEKEERVLLSGDRYPLISTDSTGYIREYLISGKSVRLLCNSEWMLVENHTIRLPGPVACDGEKTWVSPALFSYVKNMGTIREGEQIKIMIDPGHGGKDPGAMGNGLREKDIVLDIARRLARQLRASGVKVYMTRDKDAFISLRGRAKMANKIMPDVFISIHANSSRSKTAKGIEVYYVSEKVDDSTRAVVAAENSALRFEGTTDDKLKVIVWDIIHTENRAESRKLAEAIAHNIAKIMRSPNRGAKGAPFYVLKWTNVPSVLIEVGFISNPQEARKLADPAYREKIARAIFEGLISYFEELRRERKGGG